MAKWLKAAEDLFEVVDRRAKLVANDLSDEQPDSQPSASVEKEFQARRTKSKEKKLKKLSTGEPPKTSDTAQEQNVIQPALYDTTASNGKVTLPSENAGTISDNSTAQTSNEMLLNIAEDMNALGHSSSDTLLASDVSKHDDDNAVEVTPPVNGVEVVTSSSNDEKPNESNSYVHEGYPPLVTGRGLEVVNGDHPVGGGQSPKSGDEGISLKIDRERSESESVETHSNNDTEVQDADHKGKPLSDLRMQQVYESDASSVKVQDQLDEAQGLLKTAISTGQSKEARLARVCAGLSSRLQEYKSENAQLEELLFAEREHSNSYEARIKQLQQDISISKIEATRVESNMAEALAAKNSEIEALVSSMDALKKQAAVAEGNLASLQANMESSMRSRELTETRMMQALREELASAERRAVEERAAHNATKMAAMERQVELEHRSVEASTALARIQRIADERASKAAELEQKVALLEVECASLNQELQDTEARIRREQRRSSEESNQVLQMQAWQEEVERARQGQRDAERKLSSMEAEVQKMRVEMAGMKRDAEHYSRQEHVELEKRYRELTDLLYYKQTQLETMASEKAATEFQLEKEMKRLQEAQVEAERSRPSRRASSSWEEDTDLRTLEPLPLHHRHMVGASIQLQKAAKLLDSGAVRATRFLWRYPTARVILLFYLVFVHLFLMYLLHRLQEQADSFASREVAASMGLATPNLP